MKKAEIYFLSYNIWKYAFTAWKNDRKSFNNVIDDSVNLFNEGKQARMRRFIKNIDKNGVDKNLYEEGRNEVDKVKNLLLQTV